MKRLLFILAFQLLAGSAGAVTRYIDNGATGCTNGATNYVVASRTCTGATSATMFTSMANALSAATTVAGDILDIRGGTYDERINTNTQPLPSGSDFGSLAVTIRAHVGETVVFRPSSGAEVFNIVSGNHHIIFDRIIIDGSLQPIGGTAGGLSIGGLSHHIRFQDGEIKNTDNMCILINRTSGTGHEILRNKLYGAGRDGTGYGIYVESDGVIATGNEVYGNAGFGIHFYNGNISGDVTSDNHTINGNNIHDNLIGSQTNGGCAVIDGSNNLYYNNICDTNTGSVAIDFLNSGGGGNKIYNNTILHNGTGIRIALNYSNSDVRNNIVRTHTNGVGTIVDSGVGSVFSNNLGCVANCFSSMNPNFVDYANADFHLQTGQAIGTGINLSSIFTTDFAGTTRQSPPDPWDIGAYRGPLVDTLTLLNPNGGNLGVAGSTQTFSWSFTGAIANVRLRYDAANDGTFETTLSASVTASLGSFQFTAPAATTTGRFEVCDAADGTPCDTSDFNVTITASPGGTIPIIISNNTSGDRIGTIAGVTSAVILQAEGLQDTNYGTSIGIRANKGTAAQFSYSVLKFPTNAIPSNATVTAAQLGLYLTSFTVPDTPISLDFRNNKRDFVQSQATFNVYSTGNIWGTPGGLGAADRDSAVVCNMPITATTSQYYTCSSAALIAWVQGLVNLSIPNNGLHLERNGSGLDGIGRVFGASEPFGAALSITYTTSAATITMTSPSSGDHFFPGKVVPIHWNSQGISGSVRILMSLNAGVSFTEIKDSYPYDQADYPWPVPPMQSSSSVVFKVESVTDAAVFGVSDPIRIGGRRTGIKQ